jgi:large subunit ribosomal protein L18
MARGPRYHVPYRRRREGKTDFRKRLRHLRSGQPRLVVRRTLTKTIVQVAEYHPDGDRILAQATSPELAKMGWSASASTLPAAYLTGLLAGKRAIEAGVEMAILDGGLGKPTTGSKIYGALRGAVDGGLDVAHSEEILPSDERVRGEHLGDDVPGMFDKVKDRIMEGSA